ncbi:MAG: DUF177 domain-containing protein [Proteobacteria bacterium]|nr:DUF177 domain-containing protein [Pseudomonadota bacterium]
MSTADLPYSHKVPVATLHGETRLRLEPDAEARARIASALDLDGVEKLVLDAKVNHAQNGLVSVNADLKATVRPVCVVSLEPFEQVIDTPVSLRLAPQALAERMAKRAAENGDEDFEGPDLIEEGEIDFGQLTVEFLALSLDPYPRKPGAVFSGAGDPPEEKRSPFAALAALKDKM